MPGWFTAPGLGRQRQASNLNQVSEPAQRAEVFEAKDVTKAASSKTPVAWQRLIDEAEAISAQWLGKRSRGVEIQSELWEAARLDADFGESPTAVAQHRSKLDARLAAMQHWERIFQDIRRAKLEGAQMPQLDYDRMADKMFQAYGYDKPRSAFEPTKYHCFEDWFLRTLSPATRSECVKKAASAAVSAPVQGLASAEALDGLVTLKVSAIVVADLLKLLGSEEVGAKAQQFALRKTDYHHVHSPVDGDIESINVYSKDELFPGSEAMTVIGLISGFGHVKVMCIGEWSVQSFVLKVSVGDRVVKLDELGHFDFGSRVILIVPKTIDFLVRCGQRVFPGDPVGSLRRL
mmetsp:Transcript_22577/g.52586  ORF Transcript_22577/g.52586 Transcript_22577/m.52586 type:complete len:348 (-) Transcript_22577:40-1083(-)